ncbi:hypothetical protein [Epilithonimonas lactis]|uniref:hypothetical protein n=1 Tax=Epilithonimonas lactis TaxID=421072 RepID=UPI0015876592|nr:hypothetical protein [Epilithonimonas lactis]
MPFLSLIACAFGVLNCAEHDDAVLPKTETDDLKPAVFLRGDTIRKDNPPVYPDPPVRDGDNWRTVPINN